MIQPHTPGQDAANRRRLLARLSRQQRHIGALAGGLQDEAARADDPDLFMAAHYLREAASHIDRFLLKEGR